MLTQLDLPRFMGLWYEIACIAYFTQRKCICNTLAEYRLRDDGDINVTHSCQCRGGESVQAKGLARVMDWHSNAKWQVSFVSLFGTYLFWDDYWVLGVGDDYEYALIGMPSRRRGWLLARQAQIEDATVDQWLQGFAAFGYDIQAFKRTVQRHSPNEAASS